MLGSLVADIGGFSFILPAITMEATATEGNSNGSFPEIS
jgi:hypothetical protein